MTVTSPSPASPADQTPPGPDPSAPARPVSDPGEPRGWPGCGRAYALCLGVLAVAYLAIFGWLLVTTDFLPYVYDNNETYSSIWHAHNLLTFDFTRSWGLTDEAYGPNPAAHPFVHTHQGNVPRLFATVIYLLGARTPQSQIVVTTFSVGVLAVFLFYAFLARRAGPFFALVAALVLISDYLFYAQWHVVTYRVWYLFFVFSSLVCVDGIGGPRRRLWLMLSFLNFAALFYFELIFVAFVAILSGLYALWCYARRPRVLLAAWFAEAAGGLAGLGVLVLQLRMYLGWAALAEDVYLTFFARNRIANDPAMLDQLDTFYKSRNIVFWFNLVDVSDLRTLPALIREIYENHLQALTPLLTLLVLIVVAGWLVGALSWPERLKPLRRVEAPPGLTASPAVRRVLPWFRMALVALLIVGPLGLLVLLMERDFAFMGLRRYNPLAPWWSTDLQGIEVAAPTVVGVLVLMFIGLPRRESLARLPLARALLAALVLVGTGYYIEIQSTYYQVGFASLWLLKLGLWLPLPVNAAVVGVASSLAAVLALFGTRRILGSDPRAHALGVVPYLLLSFLALYLTYLLSPGYVISGYLRRGAPLVVFLVDVVIAVGLYVPLVAGLRGLRLAIRTFRLPERPDAWGGPSRSLVLGGASAAALAAFAFLAAYWLNMQATYLSLLPPNHYAFLPMLAEPPFRGASFATNTYAAPAAYSTGQWAYIDATLARGDVTLTDAGFVVAQELETYVWLADRRSNPEYRQPDYYLCMRYQSLTDALYRLRGVESSDGACSEVPIVKRADSANQPYLQYRVVARDPTPFDGWAIVKLDWDYPPYLRPLPEADGRARVAAEATPGPDGTALDVRYVYAQQQDRPEEDTVVRLYGLVPGQVPGGRCLLAEQRAPGRLIVPAGVSGQVQVSVQPATSTKRGDEYFGGAIQVGGPGAADAACPAR